VNGFFSKAAASSQQPMLQQSYHALITMLLLLLPLPLRLQVHGYFNKPQPPISRLPQPIQFSRILNQAEYRAVLARLYKQLQVRWIIVTVCQRNASWSPLKSCSWGSRMPRSFVAASWRNVQSSAVQAVNAAAAGDRIRVVLHGNHQVLHMFNVATVSLNCPSPVYLWVLASSSHIKHLEQTTTIT
jgi:hypothetical protein